MGLSSNIPFLEKGRNVAGMAFELAKSSLKEIQIYSGDLLMHEFLLLTWLLCTKAVGSVKAKHSKIVRERTCSKLRILVCYMPRRIASVVSTMSDLNLEKLLIK